MCIPNLFFSSYIRREGDMAIVSGFTKQERGPRELIELKLRVCKFFRHSVM